MRTINHILLSIFLICFLSLSLFGETDYADLFSDLSDDIEQKSPDDIFNFEPDFKLSLSGEHEFEFHIPVIKGHMDFEGYVKSPKFKNDLGIEINYKILKLTSFWQLDLIMNQWGDWQQILDARPDENYIAINPWKFKLSAGYMKYTWGTADGFNPTDNINPLDLRNTLDPVKIPLLSAYIGFFPIDQLSLEVIYAPFEQADQSDIDLVDTLQSQYSAINPSLSINEKFSDYDLSSFILGGKVNFFFRYIDFSLSYLYNSDSAYSPIIKKTTDPTGIGLYYIPSEIDLIKRRLHHFGSDFKTNVGIFGIWGEICFTLTEDYLLNSNQIRNHKLNWIAGLEFNYGPNDDFYFNIQYFEEFIFLFDQGFYQDYEDGNFTYSENLNYYRDYYYRSMTDMLANQLQGLYQGLLINMSWPVMNSLITPSLITGYTLPLFYDYNHEIRYGTLIIKPELDIMTIDSFHIVIGADLVFSWIKKEGEEVEINETDRFGVNYSNSNIYLELRYKWGFDLQK